MPVDFGMLNQNMPAQIGGSFAQGRQNRLAQLAAERQGRLQEMQLGRAEQEMADEETLRNMYQQSGGDVNVLHKNLMQRGMIKEAMSLQDYLVKQQEAQKKAAAMQQFRGQLTPEEQAAFDVAPEVVVKQKLTPKKPVKQIQQKSEPLVQIIGPDGKPIFAPRSQAVGKQPAPKTSGTEVKATEDERKAAGWLSQADNAYKNMLAAMKESAGAESPSLIEALATEDIKGAFRDASRQKFVQATKSLSEALLRAATGAGVNESEAKQKIEELTPSYFDKPETKQQKLAAIPIYLESLRTRAGRAAPEGYKLPNTDDEWSDL